MSLHHGIVLLAIVASSAAFTAEFIPKAYYVIHSNGEKSPTVFLREKRSLQEPLFPLVRMRRSSGGGSGSGSGSFSSSSSFAGSGAGAGGNDAIFFPDNFAAGLDAAAKLAGFPNGFPGGIPGAGHAAGGAGFPGAGHATGGSGFPGSGHAGGVGGSGCSSCGGGAQPYGGGDAGHGLGGPDLHSRFGGDDGVSYSGSAPGARGVFSASSSSIDGDGNVKYSVKTGKY